jgi:hypothetical protein
MLAALMSLAQISEQLDVADALLKKLAKDGFGNRSRRGFGWNCTAWYEGT